MILVFLIIFTLTESEKSSPMQLFGNWSDSSILDETYLFFNQTHPELLDKVKEILGNQDVNEISDVLIKLNEKIPNYLFGLLHLSLVLRYFHPKAAIMNPKKQSRPVMRGWAAIAPDRFDVNNFNSHDFQWKLLTHVYGSGNAADQLKDLMQIVYSPKESFPVLSKIIPNEMIQEEFKKRQFQSQNPISLINGRCVSNDPLDIIDALLNELQTIEILEALKVDKSCFKGIFSGKPEHEVFEYIPPLKKVPVLEHHDMTSFRNKWGSQLNVNASDPFTFLKNSQIMVKTQIFIDIHSQQSVAALGYILEDCRNDIPYGFEVVLIVDMENATEIQIAYSFFSSLMNIGTRGSCEYLMNGILYGFQKSYQKTRPVVPWNDLFMPKSNATLFKYVKDQHDYAKKYNIKNFAVIVNGQIIREFPSFTEIRSTILHQGNRIFDAAKRDLINNNTNIQKYIKNNGIPVANTDHVLHIDFENRVSIEGLSKDVILNIINLIEKIPVEFSTENNSNLHIPVFYVDSIPPKNLSFDAPPYSLHHVQSHRKFSEDTHSIFRNAKTIVGPLIFNRSLSAEELRYSIFYVKLAFMESIDDKQLTESQLLFVLLWRSTLGLRGIDRRYQPQISSAALIHTNVNSPLSWFLIMDPFSPEFRMTIEMMNQITNLKIADVEFIPAVPLANVHFGDHIQTRFIPVVVTKGISNDIPNCVIETPKNWATVRVGHDQILQHIVTHSFASGANVIKIGDQLRAPLQNGYFITLLPIGIYSTKGLKEPNYIVDSLIPKPKFYTSNGEIEANLMNRKNDKDNDEYLNVLSFVTSPTAENHTRVMIHTLIANTTKKIRLWCITGFRDGLPKNVDTVIISKFWPHFLPITTDSVTFCKAAKFALVDLIFPPDVKNVLFVDQGTVFRGNVEVLNRLDMEDAALAMPLMSSSKSKAFFWNINEYLSARFKRQFHSSSFVWYNMQQWRLNRGGDLYRHIYCKTMRDKLPITTIDDDIINVLQLKIQMITLPEETSFCIKNSKRELARKAFSLVMCSEESSEYLGKEYNELVNAAFQLYG